MTHITNFMHLFTTGLTSENKAQDRVDTGQSGHRTERTQDRVDTGQSGHRTEWTQDRVDTGQSGHRTEWLW